MKLFPVQQIMMKSIDHFGGPALARDTRKIVAWVISAYASAGPDTAPGDDAHASGPTTWLKQMGIISSDLPYAGASPLRLPVDSVYYLTCHPTERLDQLSAALQEISQEISSGTEYVQTQSQLVTIFTRHMHGVTADYPVACGKPAAVPASSATRVDMLAVVSALAQHLTHEGCCCFALLCSVGEDLSKPFRK